MDVSDLETTSNSDEEPGAPSTRSKVAGRKDRSRRSLRRSRRGNYDEDFAPEDGEVEYGAWTKTECFKVEKGLMTFGYVGSFKFSLFGGKRCDSMNRYHTVFIIG